MSAEANAVRGTTKPQKEAAGVNLSNDAAVARNAVKAYSGARVLFGAIFVLDGMFKWILIQQGLMQGTIQTGNAFNYSFLNDNWLVFGALVGLGETFGGLALVLGLFQRPAAIGSAGVMFAIWAFGGYGGAYMAGTWSLSGYTDPGGDLMLALIFVVLIFSPYAYSLASRLKLRDRWPGSSMGHKLLRFLIT
jgi:uncharacterized membrane protein YphA (DoxX/SURF4 family)